MVDIEKCNLLVYKVEKRRGSKMNRLKKWLAVLGIGGVVGVGFGGVYSTKDVSAAGQELPGIYYRDLYGANYWESSNIREWLNSDKSDVGYTTQAPSFDKLNSYSYDTESGFLSGTNFTSTERSSVAITHRRSFLSQSDFGVKFSGTEDIPYTYFMNESLNYSLPEMVDTWKDYVYRAVKDRVFLLNPAEAHEYIQKRGYPMKKGVTAQLKSRYNIENEFYNWSLSGGVDNSNTESGYMIKENGIFDRMLAKDPVGIVPAMHVKPGALVNGNQLASGKAIGEIVTFGKYRGAPITWVVSNKMDNGTVLLISEKVIAIKAYDAPGDSAELESDYVTTRDPANVEILTDLKYANARGNSDVTMPSLRVVNKDDVTTRSDGAYNVQIAAYDAGSGVKRIILPDGRSVTGSTATYRATTNGSFLIGTEDNAGNYGYTTLNVGNISMPSSVVFKTSASGWTNKDVTVDISASNDVGWRASLVNLGPSSSAYSHSWSDYSSYAGKRLRFTGKVKMTKALIDPEDYRLTIGIRYEKQYDVGDNNYIAYSWPSAKNIPFKDMDNVDVPFDVIYRVPGDFYGDLKPVFRTNPESWLLPNFKFEIRNLKVELIDNDDFGIDRIILPTGESVNSSSYVDTLTREGTYEYRVVDNRGLTTRKTVDVKIDKVAPTISATGNPTSWTGDDATLRVTAADALSGVKRIQKPNGEWYNGSVLSYVVVQNGTYTFTAEDNAGNTTPITVVVNRIDTHNPKGVISRGNNATWVAGSDTLTFNGTDALSGVKRVRKPDGTWVTGASASQTITRNGTYEFTVEDNAGNVFTTDYEVTNLTHKPNLLTRANAGGYVDTSWGIGDTWQSYEYTLKRRKVGTTSYTSVLSGVTSTAYADRASEDVGLPSTPNISDVTLLNGGSRVRVDYDASTDSGTGYEYIVEASGVTNNYLTVSDVERTDILMGLSGYSVLIDKNPSTIPDTTVETTSTTYEMPKGFTGGFYVHVRAIDRAGNGSTVSHYHVNDDVAPVLNVTANTTSWTTGNVILNAVASDAGTGVKRVKLPNGVWVDGSSASYTATVNGTYVFEAEDVVGNVTTRSYVVSNIERVDPTGNVSQSPANATFTNDDVTLTLSGVADTGGSGFKNITKPDGSVVTTTSATHVVTSNGTYEFIISDNAGNTATRTLTVTNIDKVVPVGTLTQSESGASVLLTLSGAADSGGSGLLNIEKPDGTLVTGVSSTTHRVTSNGVYTFKVRDRAGNILTRSITVTAVDNDAPTGSISVDKTAWTNGNVVITVSGVSDVGNSGFKQITRPDGTKVTTTSTTYVATGNGVYDFDLEDNAGNIRTLSYTVTNIDKSVPSGNVSQSPAAGTWTNGNITLTLNGVSDTGGSGFKNITKPDGTVVTTTSASQVITMNGTYEFVISDNAGNTVTRTIVVSDIDKVSPVGTLTQSGSGSSVSLSLSGVADYGGSGILNIEKPDGTLVTGVSSVTYAVTSNGVYTFKIRDRAGNITTRSITVTGIDNDAPTGTISVDKSAWTNGNVVITVSGVSDVGSSGFKQITRPDGSKVTTTSTTYPVSSNGVYDFDLEDNVGNIRTLSYTVTNIDTSAPSGTLVQSPSAGTWTNGDVTLTLSGVTDAGGSGILSIERPDGTVLTGSTSAVYTVTTNGTYTFKIRDHAGNITLRSITVSNIDKVVPVGTITPPSTAWTNGNVVLNLTGVADSGGSGLDEIELPVSGTKVTGTSASYTASSNGTYTFKIYDRAGNVTSKSYVVNNIDKMAPTANVVSSTTAWTNGNVVLTLSGAADTGGSGLSTIKRPDGTTSTGTSVTYTVTTNGTYVFEVTDNAGNVTIKSITVSNIETTDPVGTLSQDPSNGTWTNGNVTLTLSSVSDAGGSGLKEITKPDGTKVTGTGTTFVVTSNGTYSFVITDNAGNTTTKTVVVTNIDKVNPTGDLVSLNTAWTNGNVTLRLQSLGDVGSGVRNVKLPSGVVMASTGSSLDYTVTTNGTYMFEIYDVAGNMTSKSIIVSNIDKSLPTNASTSHATAWVNSASVPVTVSNGTDGQSGVWKSQYKMSGATVLGWTDYSGVFNVTAEGITNVTVRTLDKVGNASLETSSIIRIDRTVPVISEVDLVGNRVNVVSSDALSGLSASPYKLSSRTVGLDTDFNTDSSWSSVLNLPELRANAKYEYRTMVRDNAGNVSTSTTKTYMTKPVFDFADIDKEIADNAVRFTLRDDILPGGDTTLEIYRSGSLYAMIKNGNQFVDRGVSYDKDYTYRIFAVTEVDGNRVMSESVDTVVKVGMETINFDLDKSTYYSTTFSDEVAFSGTARYRQGGDVQLFVDGKKEKSVYTQPFSTTEWKLKKTISSGEVMFRALIDDNGLVYEKSRKVRVDKKNVSTKDLGDHSSSVLSVYN